jgi:hypothetical protein
MTWRHAALLPRIPRGLLWVGLCLAALWGGVRPAPGQDRPAPGTPEQLRGEVNRLIRELRSPQKETRERAERRLLSLGPGALGWFPAENEVEPAGVRVVVARVRQTLEQDLAKEATQPTRLELRGRRSIADWAAEITRQTANRILVDELAVEEQGREVTCDRPPGDFWPEFEAWAQLAGLSWRHAAEQVALSLVAADPHRAAPLQVSHVGAHRLALETATWRPRDGQAPLLRLRLLVVSEPRLRHLLFQWRQVDQAVHPAGAAEGENFPLFSPDGQFELPPAGGHAHVQLDVVPPVSVPAGKWQWRGELRTTVAPLNLPARFDNLNHLVESGSAERPQRRRGGVLVTLEEVLLRPEDDDTQTATIRIAVHYNRGGPEFESHRAWLLHNDAWLETAAGQRVTRESISDPTFHANGAVGMSYRFGRLPKPWTSDTFVYSVPALIIDLPVRFSLDFDAPPIP